MVASCCAEQSFSGRVEFYRKCDGPPWEERLDVVRRAERMPQRESHLPFVPSHPARPPHLTRDALTLSDVLLVERGERRATPSIAPLNDAFPSHCYRVAERQDSSQAAAEWATALTSNNETGRLQWLTLCPSAVLAVRALKLYSRRAQRNQLLLVPIIDALPVV